MAHRQQLEFVSSIRGLFPAFFSGMRVLEVGSLDVNGSVRPLFADCNYTGIDVAPGPGVDHVCQGQDFDAPDGSFDVVVSCEVMEHNPFWVETFANMARLTRPGGLVVMTCASSGRPEHGTERTTPGNSPLTSALGWTYYRNLTEKDFRSVIDLARLFSLHAFYRNWESCDLYFVGFRAGAAAPAGSREALRRLWWQTTRRNLARPKVVRNAVALKLLGEKRYFRLRGQMPPGSPPVEA